MQQTIRIEANKMSHNIITHLFRMDECKPKKTQKTKENNMLKEQNLLADKNHQQYTQSNNEFYKKFCHHNLATTPSKCLKRFSFILFENNLGVQSLLSLKRTINVQHKSKRRRSKLYDKQTTSRTKSERIRSAVPRNHYMPSHSDMFIGNLWFC